MTKDVSGLVCEPRIFSFQQEHPQMQFKTKKDLSELQVTNDVPKPMKISHGDRFRLICGARKSTIRSVALTSRKQGRMSPFFESWVLNFGFLSKRTPAVFGAVMGDEQQEEIGGICTRNKVENDNDDPMEPSK